MPCNAKDFSYHMMTMPILSILHWFKTLFLLGQRITHSKPTFPLAYLQFLSNILTGYTRFQDLNKCPSDDDQTPLATLVFTFGSLLPSWFLYLWSPCISFEFHLPPLRPQFFVFSFLSCFPHPSTLSNTVLIGALLSTHFIIFTLLLKWIHSTWFLQRNGSTLPIMISFIMTEVPAVVAMLAFSSNHFISILLRL